MAKLNMENHEQRVAERKKLNAMKNQGPPLGGAPEIPKGKLANLMAPQPNYDTAIDVPPSFAKVSKSEPEPFIPGVGSAYAVNQAQALGKIGAVSMGEAGKLGVSKMMAQSAPEQKKEVSLDDKETDEEDDEDTPSLKKDLEDADEEIAKKNQSLQLDLASLAGYRDALTTPERKLDIESRLEPLDIADLIVKQEITQKVIVIPGKVFYTFRTFKEFEYLWCREQVGSHPGSPSYLDEMLNVYKLVCALVSVNDRPLPSYWKDKGTKDEKIDKELFEKKLHIILGFPVQMIADLFAQGNWFNERVLSLFTVRNLKNG